MTSHHGAPIIPSIRYRDALAAIEWLCRAFGFAEHFVVPGPNGGIAHAQLTFGNSMLMLGSASNDEFGETQAPLEDPNGTVSQSLYIVVKDVGEHFARASAAGANITMQPTEQDYGGTLYSCRDLEGNVFGFGDYDPWASHD